ncbi:MAG: SDR family oxidoreductase [Actinomycetes bacterium]
MPELLAEGALGGRVAVVTGGGTNLGLAAASELGACGASVVIAGRRREVLDDAIERIPGDASAVCADIREDEGAEAIIAAALERHGRLDLLLNNAGGQFWAPAEGISTKGFSAVRRLNVEGTLRMCEAAWELAMRPAASGTIINTTVSPHTGMPGMAHTGVARAAVEALGRELATRWGGDGVSVVSLALGRFATESLKKYPEPIWQSAERTVPLQRLGDVADYGALVALLAGPLGRAMSGTTIDLDGCLANWHGAWPPDDTGHSDGLVPTESR